MTKTLELGCIRQFWGLPVEKGMVGVYVSDIPSNQVILDMLFKTFTQTATYAKHGSVVGYGFKCPKDSQFLKTYSFERI